MKIKVPITIIDMHCHGRDMRQGYKITIEQFMREAISAGISVFGFMPNTDLPITTLEVLERYIFISREACKKFKRQHARFFIWFGATDDNFDRAKEALKYPEVIGLKFYRKSFQGANVTTGTGIGVSKISSKLRHMELARDAGKPTAHHCDCPLVIDVEGNSICAEVADLAMTIALGYEVAGSKIVICHVSNKTSAEMILSARQNGLDIVMELMPQYLWFDSSKHNWNPELDPVFYHYYNNLRTGEHREYLLKLPEDNLDAVIVSSDSACHTWQEKLEKGLGGIPSHQHMVAVVCTLAKELGLSDSDVARLLSWNAADFYGLDIDRGLVEVELEERIDNTVYNNGIVENSWRGSKLLFPVWKKGGAS